MDKNEVLKLAKLARVDISEGEAEALSKEFDSILAYVGEIKGARLEHVENKKDDYILRNVMREDENPHQSSLHTEALLAEAPARQDDYVKVKKIL